MIPTDYFILAILGLLPSLLWLLYYLHQDNRPEPKKIVLQVFLLGALMGPLAILAQLFLRWLASPAADWHLLAGALNRRDALFFLNVIIFAPLSEEFLKFIAVRWRVLRDPAFDEPFDAMLYLIISALGFAAVENLLYLFMAPDLTISGAFTQTFARFVSATFLHTISSGLLGFFLAISWLKFKKRKLIFLFGFSAAVALHGFYNWIAWQIDANQFYSLILVAMLVISGGLIHWQLHALKKEPSVCRI